MEEKRNQLKGRTNYLAWKTRLEMMLTIDDILRPAAEGEGTGLIISGTTEKQKSDNEKKAKKYLIQNCDDKVIHSIDPSCSFHQILAKLNSSYRFSAIDPSIIVKELQDLVNFHPSKDPAATLEDIDIKLGELRSA